MTGRSRRSRIEELLHETDHLASQLRGLAARLEEFTAHLDESSGGDSHAETADAQS